MTALNVLPPAELRPFVRAIQYMDLPPTEEGFVIPAQGRSTLILPAHTEYTLEGEIANRVSLELATVLGPHDVPIVNRTRLPIRGYTVDFTPLGAVELLGVPQGELVNRGVAAEDLLAKGWVRELVERVNEASDVGTGLSVIHELLRKVPLKGAALRGEELILLALDRASQVMVSDAGGVRELGDLLDVQARQLNRLFHRYFGIGPRRFFLIRRVQVAMGRIADGVGSDIDALAQEMGFFDYPHFSHEFKRSTMTTPKRFGSSSRHREYQVVAGTPSGYR